MNERRYFPREGAVEQAEILEATAEEVLQRAADEGWRWYTDPQHQEGDHPSGREVVVLLCPHGEEFERDRLIAPKCSTCSERCETTSWPGPLEEWRRLTTEAFTMRAVAAGAKVSLVEIPIGELEPPWRDQT
jgi:hypothetical protein